MLKTAKPQSKKRRAADDIMHGLRELVAAAKDGVPLEQRFTVRTISIPEPGKYTATAVKKLRLKLEMSQAVFAESLGVSRVWVQGWERGVRQPSALARRLLDTIEANPTSWLKSLWSNAR